MAEEGRTEKVDSVDASKILGTSETTAKKVQTQTEAESKATLSLVFGILSIAGGFGGVLALAFAIAGIVLASQAKKQGYDDAICKAGFYTSLIGIILGAMAMVIILLFVFGFIGMGVLTTILSMIAALFARSSSMLFI